MGMPPDSSPYGSQTVMGPAWPNIDEEQLTSAAATYQKLATKITGTVVPDQTQQWAKLAEGWQGLGSLGAEAEAGTVIAGHTTNGLQAQAMATQLLTMSASVVQAKTTVNATAEAVQQAVEAVQALPISNTQEIIEGLVKEGLAQNVATVTAASSEVSSAVATDANLPQMDTPPSAQATQASSQAIQQMMSMLTQLPQMLQQIPQQMTQPLQQLSQPLQQLTQMFGSVGKGGSGAGTSPFSAFSSHPAAGGSGAASGAGLVKSASLPGAGGGSAQTPLMGKLTGTTMPVSVSPAMASSNAVGLAPVAAAGGMGGGGMGPGMMGQRGSHGSGGTTAGLGVPAPLEHDIDLTEDDDDW